MWMKFTIPLVLLVLFTIGTDAQARRARIRQQPRPAVVQPIPESEEESSVEDAQPVIQYYRAQPKQDSADELVYVNEEEFQNLYAQQQQQRQQAPRPTPREYRPVVTTSRPIARNNPAPLPRSKTAEVAEKAPPVQTIRNYNKVNDDGSFTFGYEAADGSFKEETRGTDCVVRGRYGYVDPEGNKREFTYVSGNPCDPNNPDGSEEEENNKSDEDLDENVPQNYPKRPLPARPNVPQSRPRPSIQATTRAPTTIFSNNFSNKDASDEEYEDDRRIQYAPIPKTSPRPVFAQTTPRRPSVQVIPQTTTARTFSYESPSPSPVTRPESINITPKPLYRINHNHVLSLQQNSPQLPATTYRPQIVTQKPAVASTPAYVPKPQSSVSFGSQSNRNNNIGGSIDFDAEFKKFQSETGFSPVTPSNGPSPSTKTVKIGSSPSAPSGNPIYQTQLVYNPSSGQYDANLYQAIAQTDGQFQLNQRIQPYVPQQQQYQPQPQAPPQTFFRPSPQINQATVPQQVYQKQQNELQFVNSQQLFAQQVQQQQSQLQRDRSESAKRLQSPPAAHRFQLGASEPSPILRGNGGQQYYYLQPSAQQSGGQIDAFLRGHNLEY